MRFVCWFFLCALLSRAEMLTPVWVELGANGKVLARVVVSEPSGCPTVRAGKRSIAMTLRGTAPPGFKPVCEAEIPAGTQTLRAGKQRLRLPKTPVEMIVIGDTGCRVKNGQVQACDNPALWPFQTVCERVARMKPDLVVHVGDYLYRETVCPKDVPACAGPSGDNWETWNADFFTPARAALKAAPWIFARGNHESCQRSFTGWFYYLDPSPYVAGCQDYTPPYVARAGTLRIGVLDTGATIDQPPHPAQIARYAEQLRLLSGRADWLADHHPFFGFVTDPKDGGLQANLLTLGPAWASAQAAGIRLILSGHVHLFEFLAMQKGRPNQLIAGDGGTKLDAGPLPDSVGSKIPGALVREGELKVAFGFTELRRKGNDWTLKLRNSQGVPTIECVRADSPEADCRALGAPLHVEEVKK